MSLREFIDTILLVYIAIQLTLNYQTTWYLAYGKKETPDADGEAKT